MQHQAGSVLLVYYKLLAGRAVIHLFRGPQALDLRDPEDLVRRPTGAPELGVCG